MISLLGCGWLHMFLQTSNNLFQGVYLCAGCLAAGIKQPL